MNASDVAVAETVMTSQGAVSTGGMLRWCKRFLENLHQRQGKWGM